MKSKNKNFYYQWFAIGVLITFVCIAFGFYVSQIIARKDDQRRDDLFKERHEQRVMRPFKERLGIMKYLIESGKTTPEEAFHVIDKTHEAPIPSASYLLDEEENIVDSHESESFHPDDIEDYTDFQLSKNRVVRIYLDKHSDMMPPPPPRRGKGPGPGGPPTREALQIGMLAIAVSIVVGIGLSLIVLTIYLRRKSKDVEAVMERIKSGELGARFRITRTDEAGLLMVRFNEMADEIEQLVTNLRNTEETRKIMLQELAHDLRTPVASLKTLQETLFQSGHLLPEEQSTMFKNLAMKEVAYFQRLVEDLLFLSGVNDPRYGQSMKHVDLTELIKEEMETFELSKKNITYEGPENIDVLGDAHLLRRLLKNILTNAVRYASQEVKVTLEQLEGNTILMVRDDGPGLAPEALEVFGEKKFSRQINHDDDQHISIGLGSVIIKKIMDLHGGELKVANRNPGAEIKLSFINR